MSRTRILCRTAPDVPSVARRLWKPSSLSPFSHSCAPACLRSSSRPGCASLPASCRLRQCAVGRTISAALAPGCLCPSIHWPVSRLSNPCLSMHPPAYRVLDDAPPCPIRLLGRAVKRTWSLDTIIFWSNSHATWLDVGEPRPNRSLFRLCLQRPAVAFRVVKRIQMSVYSTLALERLRQPSLSQQGGEPLTDGVGGLFPAVSGCLDSGRLGPRRGTLCQGSPWWGP